MSMVSGGPNNRLESGRVACSTKPQKGISNHLLPPVALSLWSPEAKAKRYDLSQGSLENRSGELCLHRDRYCARSAV